MAVNDLQLLAIPELANKHFFIPDYQRGYRWEKLQVFQLLEDLWHYFKANEGNPKRSFYCLQPIVVKECDEETIRKNKLKDLSDVAPYLPGSKEEGPKNNIWYEVIDGQQRLTTIRILLEFYQEWNGEDINDYKIKYETRPELSDIFNKILLDRRKKSYCIDESFSYTNVDVEYVKNCVSLILEWFTNDAIIESQKSGKMASFLSKLYNSAEKNMSVQVIWYETKEDNDARDIFERLNNLRVPLSSSELIRALFLSSNAHYKFEPTESQKSSDELELVKIALWDKEKKQSSINAKWDEIEHFFRNEDHWAFVTNHPAENYRNRIEILFDLMAQKHKKGKDDRLYTYIWFDQHKDDLWGLWEKVLAYYDTIRFWFEDNDYYHQIGFLIHERSEDIIIKLLEYANSQNHKRSEFKSKLESEIRACVNLTKDKDQISKLLYDVPSDYRKLKTLLLLYNVEYTRLQKKENRFPFSDYKKAEEEQNGWTLEHIHAQNSECLNPNNRQEWLEWVESTLIVREQSHFAGKEKQEKALIDKLKTMEGRLNDDIEKESSNVRYEDIVVLFGEDMNLYSDNDTYTITHLISNLALLSGSINSGIGKGSFSVKQQYINACIAKGEYIPICTQRVFLKHYHDPSTKKTLLHNQLLSWSDDDRKWYYAHIKTVLSTYFKETEF